MVWGGALRTVIVWHQTWFVNSAAHLWGYRNYETRDDSRNNVWAGILCNGDGWHNNHHADPVSARHGHKPWEIDLSWLTIRAMMAVGLARDVVLPSATLAASFKTTGPQLAPAARDERYDNDVPLAPICRPHRYSGEARPPQLSGARPRTRLTPRPFIGTLRHQIRTTGETSCVPNRV